MKDNQREDTKLAYIAGLIDGEGSIRIQKCYDRSDWNVKYTPIISFTNTNLEAVELIKEFFQSRSYFRHGPGMKGYKGNKPCYRVQRAGKNAVAQILKKIVPYLLIKRRQAELIIHYAESFVAPKAVGRGVKNGRFIGGKARSEEESSRREGIWYEVNQLNCYHPQRLNEKTPKGEAIV